ncbi:alpha/beta fold hydrolase [Cellulomonas triticagri]|uniref:alpha/beta fold hydrolase n=1 Tax=Cellulomonas triticagri TaxID=2483352 RepID=UPI001F185F96|nr:alpha/beta hydrolase [Cellulomonas triticagri]
MTDAPPSTPTPAAAVHAPDRRSARADDGITLLWQEEGSGPPVLLLQGQATPAAGWDRVAADLATEFRVLRGEQRGVGGSGPVAGTNRPVDPASDAEDRWTTRALAQDVRAVLDAAGVDRVQVVGHSMGGKIAQWLAVDHPERVASLTLLATSAGTADGVPRDEAAHRLLIGRDAEARTALFFDAGWVAAHADEVRTFFTLDAPRRVLRGLYRASTEHDTVAVLPRITAPTLVVHGGRDRLAAPDSARRLAAGIPGARLVLLPDAGHGLHLDSPEAATAVRDFLREHAGR